MVKSNIFILKCHYIAISSLILRVLSTDQEAAETKPNLVKYVKRLS